MEMALVETAAMRARAGGRSWSSARNASVFRGAP